MLLNHVLMPVRLELLDLASLLVGLVRPLVQVIAQEGLCLLSSLVLMPMELMALMEPMALMVVGRDDL